MWAGSRSMLHWEMRWQKEKGNESPNKEAKKGTAGNTRRQLCILHFPVLFNEQNSGWNVVLLVHCLFLAKLPSYTLRSIIFRINFTHGLGTWAWHMNLTCGLGMWSDTTHALGTWARHDTVLTCGLGTWIWHVDLAHEFAMLTWHVALTHELNMKLTCAFVMWTWHLACGLGIWTWHVDIAR